MSTAERTAAFRARRKAEAASRRIHRTTPDPAVPSGLRVGIIDDQWPVLTLVAPAGHAWSVVLTPEEAEGVANHLGLAAARAAADVMDCYAEVKNDPPFWGLRQVDWEGAPALVIAAGDVLAVATISAETSRNLAANLYEVVVHLCPEGSGLMARPRASAAFVAGPAAPPKNYRPRLAAPKPGSGRKRRSSPQAAQAEQPAA